jgi:predicted Zn-dependent protease
VLRFLGFLVLVWVVHRFLFVPVFGYVPLVGFWATAIVVGLVLKSAGGRLADGARSRAAERELLATDSPYQRGKLGSLLASRGSWRAATPHLEQALEGDPDTIEWPYRLGQAYLRTGRAEEALPLLERVVERDEEHGYGAAMLVLAETRAACGDDAGSLELLERLERNHGVSPESAYRRGAALKRLGRKDEARSALAEVGTAASEAAGAQRRGAAAWQFRALLARLF